MASSCVGVDALARLLRAWVDAACHAGARRLGRYGQNGLFSFDNFPRFLVWLPCLIFGPGKKSGDTPCSTPFFSGGTVYDGEGNPPLRQDVGVHDGRLVAIGDLSAATARQRLDVSGLVVAPGFIDLHTHSDFTLVVDGRAQSQVHQGVTTEVIGSVWHQLRPAASTRPAGGSGGRPGARGRARPPMANFGEYLDVLDGSPLGVNVAAFVGHGTVHRAVLGDALHAGEVEDIAQMKRLVDEALDEGAAGLIQRVGVLAWHPLVTRAPGAAVRGGGPARPAVCHACAQS